MNIQTLNNVFTKPFTTTHIEVKKTAGLATMVQKDGLTELEVLSHEETLDLRPGDIILVESDKYRMPWAMKQYSYAGASFIQVPLSFILGVKRARLDPNYEPPRPPPTSIPSAGVLRK